MSDISNLNDLLRVTVDVSRRWGISAWWRGHADCDWTLTPGAFRLGRTRIAERNMAIRFMMKARTRRVGCPDENDLGGWFSLMQHYRLPTRLLDWSEMPLAALFFAVTELPERDGCLWVLNPYQLNKPLLGSPTLQGPHGPQARKLLKAAVETTYASEGQVLALTPWENDLRMLLQASTFTVHDGPGELEKLPNSKGALERYRIPAESKAGIAQHLGILGVRRSTLFPDLENLAADLASFE